MQQFLLKNYKFILRSKNTTKNRRRKPRNVKTLPKMMKTERERLKAMKKRKENAVKSQKKVHTENQGVETGLPTEQVEGLEKEAALATAVSIDMNKTTLEDTDMI